MALGALFPALQEHLGGLFYVAVWSGVAGGVLTSLNGFMRAGAAVTRSEKRGINLLVGLGIPVLIMVLFAIAISGLE